MPRMREAMRSGWNGSSACTFSPVPTKRIGLPVTARSESAAPPRASPSILREDHARDRQPAREALRELRRRPGPSWRRQRGARGAARSPAPCARARASARRRRLTAGGVDEDDVASRGACGGDTLAGDRDRVAARRASGARGRRSAARASSAARSPRDGRRRRGRGRASGRARRAASVRAWRSSWSCRRRSGRRASPPPGWPRRDRARRARRRAGGSARGGRA